MPSKKTAEKKTKTRKPNRRFSFHLNPDVRALVGKLAFERDESEAQVVRMFIRMGLREFAKAGAK